MSILANECWVAYKFIIAFHENEFQSRESKVIRLLYAVDEGLVPNKIEMMKMMASTPQT